jgi:hypothetical protein
MVVQWKTKVTITGIYLDIRINEISTENVSEHLWGYNGISM